jgi:hypothetical protein
MEQSPSREPDNQLAKKFPRILWNRKVCCDHRSTPIGRVSKPHKVWGVLSHLRSTLILSCRVSLGLSVVQLCCIPTKPRVFRLFSRIAGRVIEIYFISVKRQEGSWVVFLHCFFGASVSSCNEMCRLIRALCPMRLPRSGKIDNKCLVITRGT